MKLANQLNLQGRVLLRHYDCDHNLLHEIDQPNIITNTGRLFFAEKILDIADTITVDKIGIGDGQTATSLDDTSLAAADSYGSGNYVYSSIRFKQVVDQTNKGFYVESIFSEGVYGGQLVAEIGLFSSEEDPYTNEPTELIARTVLSGGNQFEKAASDYLSVAWNITLG